MDDRPIGVMDSGAGGLSSCLEIRKIFPNESIVYYGDLLYLPYGEKSEEFLIQRTCDICSYLESCGTKAIVIACNTTSMVFLKHPQAFSHIKIPIFDVITPTLHFMKTLLQNSSPIFTILATDAIVKAGIYQTALLSESPSAKISQIAALEWATLVESVPLDSLEMLQGIRKYTSEIENNPLNQVILACTHYYYLEPLLKKELPLVSFHNSSTPVVKNLGENLKKSDMLASGPPLFQIYASKTTQSFEQMVKDTFGPQISVITKDV